MWFSGFLFLILSLIVEVYLWWKWQVSLIFLSGRTCTIGGWLNTFLPHCINQVVSARTSRSEDQMFHWSQKPGYVWLVSTSLCWILFISAAEHLFSFNLQCAQSLPAKQHWAQHPDHVCFDAVHSLSKWDSSVECNFLTQSTTRLTDLLKN